MGRESEGKVKGWGGSDEKEGRESGGKTGGAVNSK